MVIKRSPAKINLHLRVLGKREDGYHDIATLMQRISLYDEIEFSPREKGIVVKCPGTPLPENEDNIVYKAAKSLFSQASCHSGIEITIRKKIPIAAGLGGGSSNAATTLITLNDLMKFNYSTENLMKIGAKLGADIPFFVFGKTAWAFGIGDRLQAAKNIPQLWFVLVNPRFDISTKMIYESLNLRLTNTTEKFSIRGFSTIGDIVRELYNDLEKVTLNLHPILKELKELLLSCGALGSLMSGSGPTVFGIFADKKGALKAEERLKAKEKWAVFRAHSIN
ncbi:MAG: 4-(cytidine 5'-diphospho)-2-C-methyl-D-erythritol kinase [Thermodesulfobacteriota bacterium]|nr:4-(cytidine 5'-diphospho)-2-C-methyl-D-erythritol kinase [Thermodesulfobacteriota bacterium]